MINPYEPPKFFADPANSTYLASTTTTGIVSPFQIWLTLVISIGLSGVAFGMIGGPIGMIVGGFIAFPVAMFFGLFATIALAVIPQYDIRTNRVVAGGAAGFLSGAASLMILSAGDGAIVFMIAAGIVGAIGGALGMGFGFPKAKPKPARREWRQDAITTFPGIRVD